MFFAKSGKDEKNELIYGIKIRIVLKFQPMGVAERLS